MTGSGSHLNLAHPPTLQDKSEAPWRSRLLPEQNDADLLLENYKHFPDLFPDLQLPSGNEREMLESSINALSKQQYTHLYPPGIQDLDVLPSLQRDDNDDAALSSFYEGVLQPAPPFANSSWNFPHSWHPPSRTQNAPCISPSLMQSCATFDVVHKEDLHSALDMVTSTSFGQNPSWMGPMFNNGTVHYCATPDVIPQAPRHNDLDNKSLLITPHSSAITSTESKGSDTLQLPVGSAPPSSESSVFEQGRNHPYAQKSTTDKGIQMLLDTSMC